MIKHPLADEVGCLVFAFDRNDDRRAAVRELALRVADLEDEHHRLGELLMHEPKGKRPGECPGCDAVRGAERLLLDLERRR